jgi:hypothetical protein
VREIPGIIVYSLFYLIQMVQFIWLGKTVSRRERFVPFTTAILGYQFVVTI